MKVVMAMAEAVKRSKTPMIKGKGECVFMGKEKLKRKEKEFDGGWGAKMVTGKFCWWLAGVRLKTRKER